MPRSRTDLADCRKSVSTHGFPWNLVLPSTGRAPQHLGFRGVQLQTSCCTSTTRHHPHTLTSYLSEQPLPTDHTYRRFECRRRRDADRGRRTLTGAKIVHIFETQFLYLLYHFRGATTKIKPCYNRKIAFSHYEGHKVYSVCEVSRDLCTVGLLKRHVTFLTPELSIHYTTFMDYDDD